MEPAALDIILIIIARQRLKRNDIGFIHIRRSTASIRIISIVRIEEETTVSGVKRLKSGLMASACVSCGKNKMKAKVREIGWNIILFGLDFFILFETEKQN